MSTPGRLTRRDQQQRTREALVDAARNVFARVGYHGANLEQIAREAGYSKGAVYSNFDGKAELFLAVLDANISVAFVDGGWDLEERVHAQTKFTSTQDEAGRLIEQFALATLEFIAIAARDPYLSEEMGKRLKLLVDGYAAVAATSHSPASSLSPTELGALLASLDQGSALLSLAGGLIDQRVLRTGMRRLLQPVVDEGSSDAAETGEPAVHDRVLRERVARAMGLSGEPQAGSGAH